jgi:hypothetical protein
MQSILYQTKNSFAAASINTASFNGSIPNSPSFISQHSMSNYQQQSVQRRTSSGTILVEDFDSTVDTRFVRDFLKPYFLDLYKDLTLRCITQPALRDKKLDRIALLEYCNLPGIVNERLLK